MTDLSTLLGELDAKVAKMTPGPWRVVDRTYIRATEQPRMVPVARTNCSNGLGSFGEADRANAEGIVALINAYPALKAGIEQLQAERGRLHRMVCDARQYIDPEKHAEWEAAASAEVETCEQTIEQLQRELADRKHTLAVAEAEASVAKGLHRIMQDWWCEKHAKEPLPVTHTCPDCDREERDQLSETIDTWGFAWMEEREAAQRTEALRDISEHLPCETPCKMKPAQGKCGECGAYKFETWCAGCVARAALATEENRG